MKIHPWLKSLYDELFKVNNKNTQLLTQMIVEDRKYRVPEWFIPYISEESLISIIMNYNTIKSSFEHIDIEEYFEYFLIQYEEYNHTYNRSAVIVYLYEHGMIEHLWFIPPSVLYKHLSKLINFLDDRDAFINMVVKRLNYEMRTPGYKTLSPEYIRLYVNKSCKFAERFNVKGICTRVMTFLRLVNTKSGHRVDYADFIFESAYKLYRKTFARNNLYMWRYYYGSFNTTYIPKDVTWYELQEYLSYKVGIRQSTNLGKIKYAVNSLRKDKSISANAYRSTIETNILKCIFELDDLDSVKYLFKRVDIVTGRRLIRKFRENPNINNYSVFYYHTGYHPSVEEFIQYLKNGGSIINITPYLKISPLQYVENALIYGDMEELTKLLVDDGLVMESKSYRNWTIFCIDEFILSNYRNPFIYNRLESIFLSNSTLVHRLKNMTRMTKNPLSILLDLQHRSVVDLAIRYPNLVNDLPEMYNNIGHIKSAISSRYDIIYQVPWDRLTSDTIMDEISLNGYFIDPRDDGYYSKINSVEILGIANLHALLLLGKGFGYLLDIRVSTIAKTQFQQALYHIRAQQSKEHPIE